MYRLSPVFCCTGSVRLSRLLVQGGRESGSTFRSRHRRIHRPANTFTHSHNLQQLRARKGGARGGKAGFATLSAFPLVNCPMPKWSTPEGKNAYASSPPSGKENACRIQAPPPGGLRPQSHHETEESVSPVDMAPSEAHQTPLKYSDRKLPYRFLYKAPARSVPDKV